MYVMVGFPVLQTPLEAMNTKLLGVVTKRTTQAAAGHRSLEISLGRAGDQIY